MRKEGVNERQEHEDDEEVRELSLVSEESPGMEEHDAALTHEASQLEPVEVELYLLWVLALSDTINNNKERANTDLLIKSRKS